MTASCETQCAGNTLHLELQMHGWHSTRHPRAALPRSLEMLQPIDWQTLRSLECSYLAHEAIPAGPDEEAGRGKGPVGVLPIPSHVSIAYAVLRTLQ